MKQITSIAIAFSLLAGALPVMAQVAPITTRVSPHEVVSAHIGRREGAQLMIVYGRPYTKNPQSGEMRKIWGDLVPWGRVWRMGADEAAVIIVARPIMMGDTTIPAGAYSLFMLPMEDGTAKLIINKRIGQWGVPYNQAKEKDNELARLDLKKASTDKPVDQFTMSIDGDKATGGGTITMAWENTVYSMPFTLAK